MSKSSRRRRPGGTGVRRMPTDPSSPAQIVLAAASPPVAADLDEELPPDLRFVPVPRHSRSNGLTPERQRLFIASLAATGSVTTACAVIGCATASIYELKQAPGAEEFTAAWERATERGARRVRDTLLDQSINGIPERIYRDGELIAERRLFNTRAQMWIAAHYLPETFGSGSGSGGGGGSGGVGSRGGRLSGGALSRAKDEWLAEQAAESDREAPRLHNLVQAALPRDQVGVQTLDRERPRGACRMGTADRRHQLEKAPAARPGQAPRRRPRHDPDPCAADDRRAGRADGAGSNAGERWGGCRPRLTRPIPLRIRPARGTSAPMTVSPRTLDILRDLARRPANHDNIKATFKELLVEEFGAERSALDFEVRAPVIAGRIDALIGRTVFEAKRDLGREMPDVVRRMPDYLADRAREFGEPFVGIASDGRRWVVFELAADGALVPVKETILDPDKADAFLAWLDGVLAIRASLPPDPLTVRAELGQDSIAYRTAHRALRELWDKVGTISRRGAQAPAVGRPSQARLRARGRGRTRCGFQHSYLVIVAKMPSRSR